MSIYYNSLPGKAAIMRIFAERLRKENQNIDDLEEAGEGSDIIHSYRKDLLRLQSEYAKFEKLSNPWFVENLSVFNISSTSEGIIKMTIRIEYILSLFNDSELDDDKRSIINDYICMSSKVLTSLSEIIIPPSGAQIDIQKGIVKTTQL